MGGSYYYEGCDGMTDNNIEGKELWYLRWDGPVKCTLVAFYPVVKKNAIETAGIPEVVDVSNCFESRADCYRAAVSREMKIAEAKFKAAGDFAAKLNEEQ